MANPGFVDEDSSNEVLWRRHERISDAVLIPQARVTLRSALWNVVVTQAGFPIIPDPDPPLPGPDNPRGELGDLADPSEQLPNPELVVFNTWALEKAYEDCINAWRGRGVADIGIVALVVKRFRRTDGSVSPFAGFGRLGARRLVLIDNAFRLSLSPLSSGVSDHVDKLLGHEMGHALPTQLSNATNTIGLRHTCSSNQNIMRQGTLDIDNDGLIDNISLSSGIEQIFDSGDDGIACNGDDSPGRENIDQVAALVGGVRYSPGCKLYGTNTDCTAAKGDSCPDAGGDSGLRFVDLVQMQMTEREATTTITHELFGRVTEMSSTFSSLEFISIADLDSNSMTGGAGSDLGIATTFAGAELVTRVEVFRFVPPAVTGSRSNSTKQDASDLTLRATVWRASPGGALSEIVDPRIVARVRPQILAAEGEEIHFADAIEIEIPTSIFKPHGTVIRAQGMAVAHDSSGASTIDRLDDRADEPGFDFRFESPIFPLCAVAPEPVTAGESASIEASGLLPGSLVKAFLGAEKVGSGLTDSNGSVDIDFTVPIDAVEGERLVTVGVEGTALTADCIAVVDPFRDCNANGVPDAEDIATGFSQDINANGDPDECETGSVPWDFEGTAAGGQVEVVVEGYSATCAVTVTTVAGETAEMVAANLAAAINGDACFTGQMIQAVADGGRLTIEGFAINALDVSETITDPGLDHSMSVPDVPALSRGGLLLLAGLLIWLARRRMIGG